MENKRSKNGGSVRGRGKAGESGGGGDGAPVLSETQKLIALLKKNKVEHYRAENVEIKFSMLAFLPDAPEAPKSASSSEDTDELLFYSAPTRS